MSKIDVQIININNLQLTKTVIEDLFHQTVPFNLTVIDQGSTEVGTKEFLVSLVPFYVDTIQNDRNVELSRLWNSFYEHSQLPYLCFLNNDIRIPSNFLEDTIKIFELEPTVGIVVHSTNHPNYTQSLELDYKILSPSYCQGWDFTIRRECYKRIPDDIKWFGGDDWLFHNVYCNKWKVACALSSPIIHYHAQSRKYYSGNRIAEETTLRNYGVRKLYYTSPYTKRKP